MAAGIVSHDAWFVARTAGAPAVLRERAAMFFAAERGDELVERLSAAGDRALAAATAARSRDGALDLLAADALITLALLAASEAGIDALESTARRLREAAA